MNRIIIFLLAFMCFTSCDKKETVVIEKPVVKKTVVATKICLLPFEDVSRKEMERLKEVLEEKFTNLLPGERTFTILSSTTLPKEAYVKNRNRYKSCNLLNYERELLKDSCPGMD